MSIIIANVVVMTMNYDGALPSWNASLKSCNYVFNAIFICEMVLKLYSMGITVYIASGWNRFDMFVVLSSILDMTLELVNIPSLKKFTIMPQIARLFRVLRVTRLFKLVKNLKGL